MHKKEGKSIPVFVFIYCIQAVKYPNENVICLFATYGDKAKLCVIQKWTGPYILDLLVKYIKKGKGHPCTGTEALYRPYGP